MQCNEKQMSRIAYLWQLQMNKFDVISERGRWGKKQKKCLHYDFQLVKKIYPALTNKY